MHYRKRKWNEEIDPAFNRIIRAYLDGLKSIEIPSNEGYLVLCASEDQLKKLEGEGFPSIAGQYEDTSREDFFDVAKVVFSDDLRDFDYKKIRKDARKKGFPLQFLLSLPEFIKEKESRNYYLEAFAPLESDIKFKEYTSNMNEKVLKKWRMKLKSDYFSLILHILTLAIEDMKKDARRIEIFKQRNIYNSKLLRRYLFLIWDAMSIMTNKKSIRQLFKEAREGNDKSLFKLIQLDKTLFDHEWVRVRVSKAIYSGDMEFIVNLADAFKKGQFDTRMDNLDITLVLMTFWKAGIDRLTTRQKMDLLTDSGVKINQSESSFRQLVNRIRPFVSR